MTNQERAEKIAELFPLELDGEFCQDVLRDISSQLDEAVADAVREAVESFIHDAMEEDPRLRFFREKYKAQGFALAKEKAAGIAEHATAEHGCYLLDNCNEPNLLSVEGWIAERIRTLEADK